MVVLLIRIRYPRCQWLRLMFYTHEEASHKKTHDFISHQIVYVKPMISAVNIFPGGSAPCGIFEIPGLGRSCQIVYGLTFNSVHWANLSLNDDSKYKLLLYMYRPQLILRSYITGI